MLIQSFKTSWGAFFQIFIEDEKFVLYNVTFDEKQRKRRGQVYKTVSKILHQIFKDSEYELVEAYIRNIYPSIMEIDEEIIESRIKT